MKRYLDSTQGEIGFLVKIDATARRQVAGQFPMLFIAYGRSSPGIYLFHAPDGAQWCPYTRDDTGSGSGLYVNDSEIPDGWHRLVVVWSSASMKFYVDGVPKGTILTPKLPTTLLPLMDVGHWNKSSYANTILADFYARSEPRTDAEIAVNPLSAYQWDAKTTLKPVFEANSQRVAMMQE